MRADGDFHRTSQPLDVLDRRRRALVDLPWTMLDQRHGTHVVRVAEPGDGDGAVGDVAVTTCADAVLGCWVGDCAPLVLVGADQGLAVVHAGWRGLAAGVVDVAIRALDEPVVDALLGATIGPCCNEFGTDDLEAVAAGVHAAATTLTGTTRTGRTALDVPAAVGAACAHHGVPLHRTDGAGCTGCCDGAFSHRMRRDAERHVVAVWQTRGCS